jgi:hypothetical protein
MQWSTNLRQIKAAIWAQAFQGEAYVSCSLGQVMGIRRKKGQFLAFIRGWEWWYPVEEVLIVAAPR